jgi:hypothetical protein
MGLTDSFAQTILCGGNGDEMGVVGHQTIGPNRNAKPTAPFGHQVEVVPVVLLAKKGLLSSIPALRDMMRIAGNHDSCDACHDSTVTHHLPIVNNLVLCPRNSVARSTISATFIGQHFFDWYSMLIGFSSGGLNGNTRD